MSLADIIQSEPNTDTLQLWLKKVPYAAFLGIRAESNKEGIHFILPADEKLIGNPSLPALHGGVIGAFMEQAAAFHLIAKMKNPVLPRIIDFSLDYLRPAHLQDTYARCTVTRQGSAIANVGIISWQDDETTPNAIARAHFLINKADTKEINHGSLEAQRD